MPSFAAPDGTMLVYDAFEPRHPRGAVLFLPGWSDHAARWAALGERLKQGGLAAYLLDLRGHGRSGGRQAYLSRFSQLLGDLQAFRRAVRPRTTAPQVLVGHSFGGLVVLRYLQTQPLDEPVAAVVSSPFLGTAFTPPVWKLWLGRLLADLWPTLRISAGIDAAHLSRDPAVNVAYAADRLAHNRMTPGAWKEIQWAQRAVPADAHQIECPVLFLLAGEDRIVDAHLARAFADGLKAPVEVRWYPEMYHEVLHDPQQEHVVGDVLAYLAKRGVT